MCPVTHGMRYTPTYRIWQGMKTRCSNPNCKEWKYYGGRGISICYEWEFFENFLKDMGERPDDMTLDRIDNDGDYEPSNCRWASNSEQQLNTQRSRQLTFNGKTQTASQWCKELGMNQDTLNARLDRYGWSVDKALGTPVRKRTVYS